MKTAEQARRAQTFATNMGRDCGWHVERDGQLMAALVEPRLEDVCWWSYRVEPRTEAGRAVVLVAAFWATPGLRFLNRATGEVVISAFTNGAAPTAETARIFVRDLHSSMQPTRLERLAAWLTRWRARA